VWSTIIYLDKGRLWLWQCQIFRIFAKSANKRQTTVTINRILTQKWFLFQNIEDSSLNLTFVTVLSITKVFFWPEFESRISGAFLPWREFVCRIKGPMSKPRYKILCWRELVCTGWIYPELPYKYVWFISITILRLLFLMRSIIKKCNNLGAVFGWIIT
jgi:hypothetical protein